MTTAAKSKPQICAEVASFPATPGVYAVYTPDGTSVLYVGKAATQTLQQRWQRQHLNPRSGGSALRRSLGIYLGVCPKS